MKLFKLGTLIFAIITIVTYVTVKVVSPSLDPISEQNSYYSKLSNALQTSKLDPVNLTIRDYLNQVEFYLYDDDYPTKVILSNQKDPYWQIVSLQDFFKTAKINNKQVNLVDLSIDHPYATFKNN